MLPEPFDPLPPSPSLLLPLPPSRRISGLHAPPVPRHVNVCYCVACASLLWGQVTSPQTGDRRRPPVRLLRARIFQRRDSLCGIWGLLGRETDLRHESWALVCLGIHAGHIGAQGGVCVCGGAAILTTLKHGKTPSRSDLRFVDVLHCFAVQLLKNKSCFLFFR